MEEDQAAQGAQEPLEAQEDQEDLDNQTQLFPNSPSYLPLM